MQFYWFANYNFYSVTKQILLFLQTTTAFFLSQNTGLLILQSTVFSFWKIQFFSFPKKQFYLFQKLQFFFMSQNIVRIPVEDWHLIYTNFRKVRELLSNALVVFALAKSMPCSHIRHLKLYASRKCNPYLLLDRMNE